MNLESEILRDNGKKHISALATSILKKEQLDEVIKLYLKGPVLLSQRTSWIISTIHDMVPESLIPYFPTLVGAISTTRLDAVKRNALRIFQEADIPDELMGELADASFNFLTNSKEAVAIRVFSMTVLHNISKTYPEIGGELKAILEDQIPYESAGFKSRASKIIKALSIPN